MASILSTAYTAANSTLAMATTPQAARQVSVEQVPVVVASGLASNKRDNDPAAAPASTPQTTALAQQAAPSSPILNGIIQPNTVPLTSSAYFAEIYGQYIPQAFSTQLPYAKLVEFSAIKDKFIEPVFAASTQNNSNIAVTSAREPINIFA
jgi:hypothetical protein